MEYWRKGLTSTATSQTSTSDVIGQHDKIGGINFGVTLVDPMFGNVVLEKEEDRLDPSCEK
jgi:hypothetical protein